MKNFFDRIFGRQQLREQLAKLTVLRVSDQITLAARDREISDLLSRNSTLKSVERTLRENDTELKRQINLRIVEIGGLQAQLDVANNWIKEAATTISESEKTIVELQNELNRRLDQFNELVETNNSLSRQIQSKDATIQDLQKQLAACQAPASERSRREKLHSLKSGK